MNEWRNVPGFEGLYQINIDTPEGRCRNLNYRETGKVRELANNPDKRGRLNWNLSKNGKKTHYQAARWIALTFPELVQNEYFEGAQIDHIDTNRLNDHPSNLRWVTPKENQNNPLTRKHISDSQKGRKHPEETKRKMSERHLNHPGLSKGVIQFSFNNEIVRFYPSTRQAERETGISYTNISACCLGKAKSAGGYKWRYVKDFHPLVLRLLKNTYLVGNLLSRNAS